MTFEEFEKIVLRLYENKIYYEKMCNYPRNYSDFILEDDFVNDTLMLNSFLLDKLLGSHSECVSWFLWDWKSGYSITHDGSEYVIMNIDDYLQFKKETW